MATREEPIPQNEQAWRDLAADGGLPESQEIRPLMATHDRPATDDELKASAARMMEKHRPSLEKLATQEDQDRLVARYDRWGTAELPDRTQFVKAVDYDSQAQELANLRQIVTANDAVIEQLRNEIERRDKGWSVQMDRLQAENDRLTAAALSLLKNNGGPVNPNPEGSDNDDGPDTHIFVRVEDFKALEGALKSQGI